MVHHQVVLIVHDQDGSWSGVEERLIALASQHLLHPTVLLRVGDGFQPGGDPAVVVIEGKSVSEDTLFNHLARAGFSGELFLAAVATSPLSMDQQSLLDMAVGYLNLELTRFATNVTRRNVRIAIPADGESNLAEPFMSPTADANVVVLPRDQGRTSAVARPVVRADQEVFYRHAAVELAGVLGLWAFMPEPVVASVTKISQGVGGYEVVFASSRIKGILVPPLPIGDLVDDSGDLPIPPRYTAIDRPPQAIRRYSDAIFPDSLIFEEPVRPAFSKTAEVWPLVKSYAVECLKTFVGLPRLFWRGLQHDVDSIAGTAFNQAMGGGEGWINAVWEGMDDGSGPSFLSPEQVRDVLHVIETRQDRPLLAAIPRATWEEMIDSVLGIVDGGERADEIRRVAAQPTLLLRDKSSISPKPEGTEDYLRVLVAGFTEWSAATSEPASSDEISPQASSVPPEEVLIIEGGAGDEFFDVDHHEVVPETEEKVSTDESSTDSPAAPDDTLGDVSSPYSADSVEEAPTVRHDGSLLSSISTRFVANYDSASSSCRRLLDEIQNLPGQFSAREVGRISGTVLGGIALAIAILVVALGSMTPAKQFVGLNEMESIERDRLWLMFSTVLVVVSIVTGITGGRRGWQGRAMFAALISSLLVALEYLLFEPLYEIVQTNKLVTESAIVGVMILVGTLGLAGVAFIRNRASSDPIRHRLAKFLALVIWLYVVIGLSSYLANDDSILQGASEHLRSRMWWTSNLVAWPLLLTGLWIITVVKVNERHRMGRAGHDFRHACEELEVCVDARRRLGMALAQWLGLAAVLGRTIWYPLGTRVATGDSHVGEQTVDESILKFDLARLDLRESGAMHLLARLRQKFVTPGWLKRQVLAAVEPFTVERAMQSGNAKEYHYPFACPSTPTVDEVLAGLERGDRWDFVHRYLGGEFDGILLDSAVRDSVPDMYREIARSEKMHSVKDAQNPFNTSLDFLEDVVPQGARGLPPGLVNGLLTAKQTQSMMKTHLWWPSESLGALSSAVVSNAIETHASTPISALTYKDSEMICAAIVELSEPIHSDSLVVVGEAVQGDPELAGGMTGNRAEYPDAPGENIW